MNPEEAFVRGMAKLEAVHPTLRLDLDWTLAIAVLGHLQLALRHPANQGESARLVRNLCDALIAKVETVDRGLADVLRMGDDEMNDC